MSTPDSSLLALIKLLGDDHPEVVEAARSKLVSLGSRAVPLLRATADRHPEAGVRIAARGVLERIRLDAVKRQWERTAALSDERLDLESSALLMAQVPYPHLDAESIRRQLDGMADRVRPKFRPRARSLTRLEALNDFLFDEEGYRGDWNDYFDPQNGYLNRVLERKMGIPITLSVLYLLLAKRLRIPVRGVGLPGHFMVKYEDSRTELFVDPFNEGRILSRPECVQFIVEAGYPYQPEFLEGIRNREILARMLRNLILIHVDRRETALSKILTRFLDLLYPGETAGPFSGEPE